MLECPTTQNRPGCNSEGRCCARRVLEAERDFRDQKEHLQEEVEGLGPRVLFYPKSHCELNPIERNTVLTQIRVPLRIGLACL